MFYLFVVIAVVVVLEMHSGSINELPVHQVGGVRISPYESLTTSVFLLLFSVEKWIRKEEMSDTISCTPSRLIVDSFSSGRPLKGKK
jgi:hypothetical protein